MKHLFPLMVFALALLTAFAQPETTADRRMNLLVMNSTFDFVAKRALISDCLSL